MNTTLTGKWPFNFEYIAEVLTSYLGCWMHLLPKVVLSKSKINFYVFTTRLLCEQLAVEIFEIARQNNGSF